MVNQQRERHTFLEQWPLSQGSKNVKNHNDEYGHGQKKRIPSTCVQAKNEHCGCTDRAGSPSCGKNTSSTPA